MSKLLEVKKLTVQYTTDDAVIHAVNGISFDIEEGQTLGIVGGNRRGKDHYLSEYPAADFIHQRPDPGG